MHKLMGNCQIGRQTEAIVKGNLTGDKAEQTEGPKVDAGAEEQALV